MADGASVRDSLFCLALLLTVLGLWMISLNKREHVIISQSPDLSQTRDPKTFGNDASIVESVEFNDEKTVELDKLRQKVAIYERLNKILEFNSWASEQAQAQTRANILILSDEHSGGALLGELFNQHPRIFYVHEPTLALRYYRSNRPADVYESMTSHLFSRLFACEFDELQYFTDYLSFQYNSWWSRLASRALSEPPLCPIQPARQQPAFFSVRMCMPLTARATATICKLNRHTVVQTSDYADVRKLTYLLERGHTGQQQAVKLLHLVRDPRAVVFSAHFGGGWRDQTEQGSGESAAESAANNTASVAAVAAYARTLCRKLARNMHYTLTAPTWLAGTYSLLRYEDLASSPQHITELVYRFASVPLAQQVRAWVDRLSFDQASAHARPGQAVYDRAYAHAQNLSSAHAWRAQMPIELVRVVEAECADAMQLLGYKQVDSEKQLRGEQTLLK